MKKVTLTAVMATVVVTLPFISVGAMTAGQFLEKVGNKQVITSAQGGNEYFQPERPMTEAQIAKAKAVASKPQVKSGIPYRTETITITPNLVQSNNWHYTGIDPNNYIIGWEVVTIKQTEDVKLQLVQYPSNNSGTSFAMYSLNNYDSGPDSEGKTVYGNYKSTADTIWLYGVEAGRYQIEIDNIGDQQQDGNGFTFY